MTAQLNHTIVQSLDPEGAAQFLADILGLAPPQPFGHFMVLQTGNGVNLDYMRSEEPIHPQHYAFLISEDEFDAAFERIEQRKMQYWADPAARKPGEINHNDGGRGLYFEDPSGHFMELITQPYGSV